MTDVTSIQAVGGGLETLLWKVEAGQRYALRVFRPEQGAVAAKEMVVMRLAREAGLPVPEVRAQGSCRRRPALLIDWVEGHTFDQVLRRQPWRAGELGTLFGQLQAQLHAVTVTGRQYPDVFRQRDSDWIAWSHPDEAVLRKALRALPLRRDALLHLDLHPLNVLTAGGRVTGLLDWANARPGDPRADVARTASILRLSPVLHPAETFVRRIFADAWRGSYRSAAGELNDMPLFFAWAGAAMLADLAPHRNHPGFPLRLYDRIRRWTRTWKRRAGIDG